MLPIELPGMQNVIASQAAGWVASPMPGLRPHSRDLVPNSMLSFAVDLLCSKL